MVTHTLALTWEALQQNAALQYLDPEKFQALHSFFVQIPPDFFEHCAALVTTESFPEALVSERYAPGELEKFLLLCAVANYDARVEFYRKNNYPASMLEDIRGDLKIWVETLEKDLGFYGLNWRIFSWTRRCLIGVIKQCGRLQFELPHYFAPKFSLYPNPDRTLTRLPANAPGNPANPLVSHHDKVLNLHIPAVGPLDIDQCVASLKAICDFAAKFAPDYDYKAFVCYSWLLDPQFRDMLPPDANIIRFQQLGYLTIWPDHDQTGEVIWRLWTRKADNIPYDKLPRYNRMSSNAAQFLVNGGRFEEGLMVIPRDSELIS